MKKIWIASDYTRGRYIEVDTEIDDIIELAYKYGRAETGEIVQCDGETAGWNGYEYVKQRRDGRWGGPREGAGRPRIKDKKKGRSIKFSDEEWDEVRAKADAAGLSMSEYIRERALKK